MAETDRMLTDAAWDEQERSEITDYFKIDVESIMDYQMERTEIAEGCCHVLTNACAPFRWDDMETKNNAIHLALSRYNVMYMTEKYAVHQPNPCPPCMCCVPGTWREDFQPKLKKMIPLEKITDVEVQEADSNELVPPGCHCPPQCNPISITVPVSKTSINTAGSPQAELIINGIYDANEFRRKVMNAKRGTTSAPLQQGMATNGSIAPSQIGASANVVGLLQDIPTATGRS